MIVRPAAAGDAGEVAAIANRLVRDTLVTFTTRARTVQEVADQIAERGPAFLVCEIGGAVAGYATHGAFRAGPGYARTCEHSLAVTEDARGRGAGRALMTRLMRVAADAGLHVMVAGISGANPGAVAFHAALGFAEVGRMPQVGRKNGRWLDLILMQKILDPGPGPDSGPDSGADFPRPGG